MTTDEAFQEQCFLWERGASVGADFNLFNVNLLHVQEYKILKGGKKVKCHNISQTKMFVTCLHSKLHSVAIKPVKNVQFICVLVKTFSVKKIKIK